MAAILSVARKAFQDGSAYKPPPVTDEYDEFGEALGSKGGGISGLTASVKSAWKDATGNLGTSLSVAEQQVSIIKKEAKAEGREATEEEIEEACGPLSFLTKIPNLLNDALGDIFGKFNEFASKIGETVGEFMGKFDKLLADIAEAVDDVVREAAEAALAVFKAVNDVAVKAIEAIESVVNTVATAVNDAISFATDAFNKAIAKLSAWADTLSIGSLFSIECQKEAVEEATNKDKVADNAEVSRVLSPPVVNGTDPTLTSDQLSTPQTEFADAPSTVIPPSLEILIASYQKAARAYKASVDEVGQAIQAGRKPNITRAQQQDLESKRRSTLQELRDAAVRQRFDENTLPIYGPNFDSPRKLVELRRGTDKYGNTVVTSGEDYSKSDGSSDKLQAEIAEIKRDIARYNQINEEQFQEIRSQKLKMLNPFGKLDGTEVRASDRKLADAKALRREIEAKINKPRQGRDTETVKKAVGTVGSIKEGFF